MKPAPFEYQAPRSLEAALLVMTERGGEAKVLAGGQSLIPVMNFRLAQPALLVDLNGVPDLDYIRELPDGGLAIGAMTRQRRLERSTEVARRAPLLAEAVPWIAHPQIRNRGTIGGSLAHADPAAELPTLAVALDARLRLQRAGGERWVSAREFYVGLFATVLEAEELLVEIQIPAPPARSGWAFVEVARRHGDYAQVGLAASLTLSEDGAIAGARLVYLSVGDGPVEPAGAVRALVGERPAAAAFAAAGAAARAEIEPSGDMHASADFKRHLAEVLTRRALATAAQRAAA